MTAGLRVVIAAGVLGLLLGLLAQFPLRWVTGSLPDSIRCDNPSGTLLRGACGSTMFSGTSLGLLRWHARPSSLLLGRLRAELSVEQPGLSAMGDLTYALGGSLVARDLDVDAILDSPSLSRFTAGLRGNLSAQFGTLVLKGTAVREVRGRLLASQLVQSRDGNVALGDYELRFDDAASAPRGSIRDLGGPLEVTGTLTLTDPPGYLLAGTVRERDSASPELKRQLQFLGATDAAGRRQFAQEATF